MEEETEMTTRRRGDSDVDTISKRISILVVDDDATCLSIVAAILKKWKYEVVTVKHPIDALYTLRIKGGGAFDLVVSDVHMPDMNGFELQRRIHREFKLPVVLISADDKEGVILKGLQSGAAFFFVKPISPDDVRDLWQYATINQKGKSVVIEETGSIGQQTLAKKRANEGMESAASSTPQRGHLKKDCSRTNSLIKDGNENRAGNVNSLAPKKTKVIWTNALHSRFLEAIRSIGLDRAVPKKILELMDVPELTRENVASHLQKYRIFLKRVSDASNEIQSTVHKDVFVDSTFQSSDYPSWISNKFQRVCQQNPQQRRIRTKTFQQKLGISHVPSVFNASNIDGDLCSNSLTQSNHVHASSYWNYEQSKKPFLADARNSVHHSSFRVESNDTRKGLSSARHIWSGLVNSTQIYHPSARFLADEQSNYNHNIHENGGEKSIIHAQENVEAFDGSSLLQNLRYNTHYSGRQTATDEQLNKLGNTGGRFEEAPSGLFSSITCPGDVIPTANLFAEPAFDVNCRRTAPSPALTSAILEGNTSVSQQQLLLLPPQEINLENGDGIDYASGLAMNSTSATSSTIAHHLPFVHGDPSNAFSNPIGRQSISDQQPGGGGDKVVTDSNFCSGENQLDDLLPWLLQDGGGGLIDSNGNDAYYFGGSFLRTSESNPSSNKQFDNGDGEGDDDDEFLESVLADNPYGGRDNLGVGGDF